jgi:hypothetical protein
MRARSATCTVCLEPFVVIVDGSRDTCPECEAAAADRADQAPDVVELMQADPERRWRSASW